MIARRCETCTYYRQHTETAGRCILKTTDAGFPLLVRAGNCCAKYTCAPLKCCKTCAHYCPYIEDSGWCLAQTKETGVLPLVGANGRCEDYASAEIEKSCTSHEFETWLCLGCKYNCRCELCKGFDPVQCLLYSHPWKDIDNVRIGKPKWIMVKP